MAKRLTPSEKKVKDETGYKSSNVVEKLISECEEKDTTLSKAEDHFLAFYRYITTEISKSNAPLKELYELRTRLRTRPMKDLGLIRGFFTGKRYEYEPLSPDAEKQLESLNLKITFYETHIDSLRQQTTSFEEMTVNVTNVSRTIKRIDYRKGLLENKLKRLRADLNIVKTTEEAVWVEEEKQLKIKFKKEEEVEKLRAIAAKVSRKSRKSASDTKKYLKPQLAIMDVCPYCGNPLDDNSHADHIYPMSRGGLSMISNMVIICSECNTKKSDLTLNEFIERHAFDRDFVEGNLKKLKKRF